MMDVTISLPDDVIDRIAERVANLLEQQSSEATDWYTPAEAAAYLRCSKQRIYDLVHGQKLHPNRDGRRLLFHRRELDRYMGLAA